jgi:hypothetical protein
MHALLGLLYNSHFRIPPHSNPAKLNYVQIFLICKYLLYCYQYLIMTKFRLLIPKYIFVQYHFVLLRKFGLLIPK